MTCPDCDRLAALVRELTAALNKSRSQTDRLLLLCDRYKTELERHMDFIGEVDYDITKKVLNTSEEDVVQSRLRAALEEGKS